MFRGHGGGDCRVGTRAAVGGGDERLHRGEVRLADELSDLLFGQRVDLHAILLDHQGGFPSVSYFNIFIGNYILDVTKATVLLSLLVA